MPERKPNHAPGRLPSVPGFIEQALEAGLTQGGWLLYLRLWQTLVERERTRGVKTMPMSGSRAHRLVPEVSKATAKRALRDLVDKGLLYIRHEAGYTHPTVGLQLSPAGAAKPGASRPAKEKVVELSDFTPQRTFSAKSRARRGEPEPIDGSRPIEPVVTPAPTEELPPPVPEPESQDPSAEEHQRFEDARKQLADMLEPRDYECWGATLQLTRATKGVAVLTAPSDLALEMAQGHQTTIEAACREAGFEAAKLTGQAPGPKASRSKARSRPHQPQWQPRTITVGDARWIAHQIIRWRDHFRERHQSEPGHSAYEVTAWALYQIVYGASANPKLRPRDAAKGIVGMVYEGSYTRPRGLDLEAVKPHLEAAADLFGEGGHQ